LKRFIYEFLSGGNVQAQTCSCTDGIDNDGDGFTDFNDEDCADANGDENVPQIIE
jgi:hypothetical protein